LQEHGFVIISKTSHGNINIMSTDHLLAIDQGTTSSRAMIFDNAGAVVATAQREFPQIYPHQGWVEHDPETIWRDCLATCVAALKQADLTSRSIAGIGIANQRETTILWNRKTGEPIYNAIVWQDRRTADICERLRGQGLEPRIAEKTGLLLDPYFSATKIAWLLEHVNGARTKAEAGELAFGTIDCFLVWRLTAGKSHVTDATNASRTMLFDIHTQEWDDGLLETFGIPHSLLPDVLDNAAEFGATESALFGGSIPIRGMVGDQQAAAIGQACLSPGMIKSTYGTGCFALQNTGETPIRSEHKLLTTTAYRFGGTAHYALEGSIFIAGAAVQWLRDGLGIIQDVAETEALARASDPESSVYLVPAFTGLGAPYWDSAARASIQGLTRNSGRAEIARATLEAIGFQTRDLFEAMVADGAAPPTILRVDGGLARNGWAMQFLADTLSIPVERPVITETTALGAAYLAGLQAGVYADAAEIGENWKRDMVFKPRMGKKERNARYAGWQDAVVKTRTTPDR
jgi:glycerol kinase